MSFSQSVKELKEGYHKDMPVCNNQNDFNIAFRKAIQYDMKKTNEKHRWLMLIGALGWLACLVISLMKVSKMPPGPEKVEHATFAILFPPAYLIATWIGGRNERHGSRMFACGESM